MPNRSNRTLFPLALLGVGVGLLWASYGAAKSKVGPKFRMTMGHDEISIDIDPNKIVYVFSEYRSDAPNGTMVRMCEQGNSQDIWIKEHPEDLFAALGIDMKTFVKVHQPLGITSHRTASQWEDDDPSMELVPTFVNRAFIDMIGPSPILHVKRRRLGKLYTSDGIAFTLYESLDLLRQMVGPSVRETKDSYRPR